MSDISYHEGTSSNIAFFGFVLFVIVVVVVYQNLNAPEDGTATVIDHEWQVVADIETWTQQEGMVFGHGSYPEGTTSLGDDTHVFDYRPNRVEMEAGNCRDLDEIDNTWESDGTGPTRIECDVVRYLYYGWQETRQETVDGEGMVVDESPTFTYDACANLDEPAPGCERIADTTTHYLLVFTDGNDHTYSCTVPHERWLAVEEGQTYNAEYTSFANDLICDSVAYGG